MVPLANNSALTVKVKLSGLQKRDKTGFRNDGQYVLVAWVSLAVNDLCQCAWISPDQGRVGSRFLVVNR